MRGPLGPGGIALGYVIAALAWIIFSGLALDALHPSEDLRSVLEQSKGAAFVLVTGGLLFVLLQRHFSRLQAAQRELALSNDRLAALAAFPEHSPTPVIEFDAARTVTYSNRAARTLLTTTSPQDLLPAELQQVIENSIAAGTPAGPIDVSRHGLSLRWWFFPRGSGHVYAFALDRTEEEKLNQQLARAGRMESTGRMAASIAHDFRNVLTSIGIGAELVCADLPEGHPAYREAQQITAETQRARDLVQRLLELSRPPSASDQILDLTAQLRRIEPVARHLVRPPVTLVCSVPNMMMPVRCDGAALEQAVLNLVANAVDAIDGPGTITIEAQRDATRAVINVRDTGCGIPPEVLASIFDPFFTTKGEGKGTGLGLASVYSTVTQCGGTVDVESRIGAGSCFTLDFPLATPSDDA